jgi:hypothetical protein
MSFSYKLVTICDIKHQDVYDVYQDDKGFYYDMNGKLINIDYYINYQVSYHDQKNKENTYKIKQD